VRFGAILRHGFKKRVRIPDVTRISVVGNLILVINLVTKKPAACGITSSILKLQLSTVDSAIGLFI
jgi:hypothetical protein